jgi:hypothetical protein
MAIICPLCHRSHGLMTCVYTMIGFPAPPPEPVTTLPAAPDKPVAPLTGVPL